MPGRGPSCPAEALDDPKQSLPLEGLAQIGEKQA